MTANLKKILIIGGVVLALAAVIVGVVLVVPTDNGGSTTTTTTTTTTKPNDTTTTTKKPDGTTTTTTKPAEHVHTPVVDAAVPASCTKTGLTEGSHCSECGEVLTAQTETPIIPHTYDDKYDDTCNICGFVRDAECAHTNTEKILGQAATCTEAGLTDGVKCSKCKEILTAQTVIPKKDHTESDWIIDLAATKEEDGSKHTECTVCHTTLNTATIPATGSLGLAYTVNSDGTTCTVTGIGECTDEHVVIPTQIDGYKVTAIANRAFYNCTTMKEVTIPSTVTSIGTQIFYKASDLTTVYYNSTYSSKDNPFLNTTSIKKVVLGGKKVPDYILYNCANVTEVEINGSVTSIGGVAFCNCTSLKDVYYQGSLEDWCNIKFAYDSNPCSNGANLYINGELLTNAVIPDTVTSINDYAFRGCTSLTSVTIPDSVTSIGRDAFYNCTSLTSVTIPDSVTSIGYEAFGYCTSLKSITIPDSVTSIGARAFQSCKSLTSVTIPDSVTSIGARAFQSCKSLTSVTIPDSVTSIGDWAFYYCTSLTEIHYDGTQEQWNAISKGEDWNYNTGSYTIYYANNN